MKTFLRKLIAPVSIAVMTLALSLSTTPKNYDGIIHASGDTVVTFVQVDVGSVWEASSTGTTINSFTKDSVNFSMFAVKTKSSATATSDYGYIMLMGGAIYNTSVPLGTYVKSVSVTYTGGTGTSGSTVISFGTSVQDTRVTSGGTGVVKSATLTKSNADTTKSYFNISNTTTNNIQIASVSITFSIATSDVVTSLNVSPTTKNYFTTTTIQATDFAISITKNGSSGSSSDYTAKIGTGTGASFSGTDIIWGNHETHNFTSNNSI